MTDTNLLQQFIKERGVTKEFLARRIGCQRFRVYDIVNKGKEPFAHEITAISNALRLTNKQRDQIFFKKNVTAGHEEDKG